MLTVPMPERLYHYTGRPGLVGIVESGQLWASDINYLNDTTEIRYSRALLGRLGERLRADSSPEYAVDLVCQVAAALTAAATTPPMFVISLCHDGDNLSQWRGYAEEGRGYAIGFDREVLEHTARLQGFTMVPIIYDRSDQEEHLAEVLRDAVGIVRDWGNDPTNAPSPEQQLIELSLGITFAAMFVKDQRFVDEREWRLIRTIVPGVWDPRTRIRVVNGVDLSYEELELVNPESGALSLDEIVIGPIGHAEKAEAEVRALLDDNGLHGASIGRSSLPLRSS